MSQENVETLRRSHEAYRRGEFDAAIDTYLHPEIVWETRWPGLDHSFHGRDGVRDWLAQVMDPMEIEMELLDARALGDQVLASYRVRGAGKSSGIPTEMCSTS
jgi:limonene-1,2-epoxide hydrolase